MVTTYRLRENAKWHDGTPLTANDLVFANSVYSDPEIPVVDGSTQALIANVQATDDHTLRIAWKQPYFLAGSLGTRDLVPLPRHLLSEQAQTNKANFATGPDWSANFVGNGPFAVERWDLGSGVIARAFPDWFLCPPKFDRIEFRFIGDPNAILANLLSGEVDFTMSDFISPTLVVSTRDYWVGGGIGYIDAAEATEQYIVFQFREVPDWQRSVTDIRVRKALIHSLDRQTLADVVTAGFGSAADLFLFRSHPVYAEADRASAKYPYDPRRAGALLGEAGWNNQAGGPLRNADGQPLKLTYRRSAAAQAEQDISVVVDNWKAIGVDADGFIVPAALASDAEYSVSFPGVLASSRPVDPGSFAFTSDQKPTPTNRWTGINRGSFEDPEVDALQRAVLTLIDPADWRRALVGLNKQMSDVVGAYPLYYRPRVIMAKNELRGPNLNPPNGGAAVMWNVYEWELAP